MVPKLGSSSASSKELTKYTDSYIPSHTLAGKVQESVLSESSAVDSGAQASLGTITLALPWRRALAIPPANCKSCPFSVFSSIQREHLWPCQPQTTVLWVRWVKEEGGLRSTGVGGTIYRAPALLTPLGLLVWFCYYCPALCSLKRWDCAVAKGMAAGARLLGSKPWLCCAAWSRFPNLSVL